jgi:hypothetical protein
MRTRLRKAIKPYVRKLRKPVKELPAYNCGWSDGYDTIADAVLDALGVSVDNISGVCPAKRVERLVVWAKERGW